jgi:Fe-S cluster assembly protein SufB
LAAYAVWLKMTEPEWAMLNHPPIDYQDLHYYAAPKKKADSSDSDGQSEPSNPCAAEVVATPGCSRLRSGEGRRWMKSTPGISRPL